MAFQLRLQCGLDVSAAVVDAGRPVTYRYYKFFSHAVTVSINNPFVDDLAVSQVLLHNLLRPFLIDFAVP